MLVGFVTKKTKGGFMQKSISNIFKYSALFLSGLISGVVAGLLSAPKSGKELRKDLADKTRRFQRSATEKINETMEHGKHQVENVSGSIKRTAGKINSKLHDLMNNKTIKSEEEEIIHS